MMAMEMVVESMEMAPGALPRSGRVPEQRLLSPESSFGDDGGCGTFRGFSLVCLGFSQTKKLWAKRGSGRPPDGPRRPPGVGQGLAAPGGGLATWEPPSGLLPALSSLCDFTV